VEEEPVSVLMTRLLGFGGGLTGGDRTRIGGFLDVVLMNSCLASSGHTSKSDVSLPEHKL
jgi:hypothetical protein